MADVASVAVQTTSQPTNKVSAATTGAGVIAGVVTAVIAGYGSGAIEELWVAAFGANLPQLQTLVIMIVTGVAAAFATKFGGNRAAYNVLDAPNRPLMLSAPTQPAPLDQALAVQAAATPMQTPAVG